MNLAESFLRKELGEAPAIAVVLGSGLAGFSQNLDIQKTLKVADLPGGKASSVEGHKGELIYGNYRNKKLICLSGRLHGYEGHTPAEVVFALRSLRAWGVKQFILTNASGSTHKAFEPGDIVAIRDQINFTGLTPLTGKELFNGPRFPDSSDLYSAKWRQSLKDASLAQKIKIKEAVYIGVLGPSYETPAEIRMFAQWGADIVGMSTVWEATALKQMGAELLGLSLVSNYGTGVIDQALKHEDVLALGRQSFENFKKILDLGIEVA